MGLISNILQQHAAELLGREEIQALIDHLAKESPKFVEELVPKVVPIALLQKVLQNLLAEGLHIRDIRGIIETMADNVGLSQDVEDLTSAVRVSLSRAIVHQFFPGQMELPVMTLDPQLESVLLSAVQSKAGAGLEPGLAETLLQSASQEAERVEQQGYMPVLLTPTVLRPLLSRFLRRALPHLAVLAHNEIPDNKTIRIIAVVGGRG